MTLLIILLSVFAGITLMVILGERYAKPLTEKEQARFSKLIPVLVFLLLLGSIIKLALF